MFRPNEVDGDHTGSGSANSTHTEQYAYARLDQISAALISRTKELLSFSSRGVDLRISVTKQKTRLGFAVGYVQIDQQNVGTGTKVPVILAPVSTEMIILEPVLIHVILRTCTRMLLFRPLSSFPYQHCNLCVGRTTFDPVKWHPTSIWPSM